jgi:hypothetical protein
VEQFGSWLGSYPEVAGPSPEVACDHPKSGLTSLVLRLCVRICCARKVNGILTGTRAVGSTGAATELADSDRSGLAERLGAHHLPIKNDRDRLDVTAYNRSQRTARFPVNTRESEGVRRQSATTKNRACTLQGVASSNPVSPTNVMSRDIVHRCLGTWFIFLVAAAVIAASGCLVLMPRYTTDLQGHPSALDRYSDCLARPELLSAPL